jgi:hypothetical protein
MKISITLCLLFSFTSVWASPATCYQEKLPFFKNYTRFQARASTKLKALERACAEINNDMFMERDSAGKLIVHKFISIVSFGLLGEAAASFSSLQNSPEGRAYMKALSKIRRLKNPIERISQTYRLAAINSGEYDHATMGKKTWYTGFVFGAYRPENLLKNSRDRGTVGVCREFATLLKWSLQQVARHPDSTSMALGPSDFSAEIVGGSTPVGGHAWVRVNIPVIRNGRLVDFTHFDIDTTWYPEFTPLFPRRSGVSDQNLRRLRRECEEITNCLSRY